VIGDRVIGDRVIGDRRSAIAVSQNHTTKSIKYAGAPGRSGVKRNRSPIAIA